MGFVTPKPEYRVTVSPLQLWALADGVSSHGRYRRWQTTIPSDGTITSIQGSGILESHTLVLQVSHELGGKRFDVFTGPMSFEALKSESLQHFPRIVVRAKSKLTIDVAGLCSSVVAMLRLPSA